MGIITMALIAYGAIEKGAPAPTWVVVSCALAMGLGTAAGGVRIIKTMGSKIIDLKPIHGFAAETAAAATLFTAAHFGAPVSTTHVISSSIMGVGASQRVSAVRWGVTARIVWAWVLTIPISGLVGAICYVGLSVVLGP
jgi:PiT family inorganic phosphate transporter